MIGQMLRRRDLELAQGDMRGVQVHRDDLGGIGHQIRQDVAAARGDRDDAAVGLDLQRLHVDHRIFPDLRIDQALEGEGKGTVEKPLLRRRSRLRDGFDDLGVAHWSGHAAHLPRCMLRGTVVPIAPLGRLRDPCMTEPRQPLSHLRGPPNQKARWPGGTSGPVMCQVNGGDQPGITTVSITCTTPLLCMTSVWVTIDLPPLASVRTTF